MVINKNKLELALARACLNQRDLRKIGISNHTMLRATKGENITPKTVGKVAKALGVDVADILEEV